MTDDQMAADRQLLQRHLHREHDAAWSKECEACDLCAALSHRLDEVERKDEALKAAVDAIPTTWLDELLSGPRKVIKTADCREVEALLKAVKARMQSAIDRALSGAGEGETPR